MLVFILLFFGASASAWAKPSASCSTSLEGTRSFADQLKAVWKEMGHSLPEENEDPVISNLDAKVHAPESGDCEISFAYTLANDNSPIPKKYPALLRVSARAFQHSTRNHFRSNENADLLNDPAEIAGLRLYLKSRKDVRTTFLLSSTFNLAQVIDALNSRNKRQSDIHFARLNGQDRNQFLFHVRIKGVGFNFKALPIGDPAKSHFQLSTLFPVAGPGVWVIENTPNGFWIKSPEGQRKLISSH